MFPGETKMRQYRKNITEEQIRMALRKFEKQGGLIRTLRPQEAPVRMSVGPQYAVLENLFEAVGLDLF